MHEHAAEGPRQGAVIINPKAIHHFLASNTPVASFLFSYLATVVVGNLLLQLPSVRAALSQQAHIAKIFSFATFNSAEFWVLLLSPFIIIPLISALTLRPMASALSRCTRCTAELTAPEYILMHLALSFFVLNAMNSADAFNLFQSGTSATTSVEARFELHNRLPFSAMIALTGLTPLLSNYAIIRILRMREFSLIWPTFATLSILTTSGLLILLNMKWPILIYYAGIICSLFAFARKRAFTITITGAVIIFITYLLISAFVFRLHAATAPVKIGLENNISKTQQQAPRQLPQQPPSHQSTAEIHATDLVKAAYQHTPNLILFSVMRMALIYPYYLEIAKQEGAICGGFLGQMKLGAKCRPSKYVYEKIFPSDGFEGRGTSPSSAHVTSYALGGWGLAIFSMATIALVLTALALASKAQSAIFATLLSTGGTAGYHFSQIPLEGGFLYDHGIIWQIGAVLLLIAYKHWLTTLHSKSTSQD